MQLAKPRSFRAGVHTYIVLTIIVSAVGVYGIWVAVTSNPVAWQMVSVVGFVYAVMLIWAVAFRICITDAELVFRSLFGGRKRISLHDIGSIRLDFSLAHGGGPLRLIVESRSAPGEIAMAINAKVFSDEAVRAVLDLGKRIAVSDSAGLDDGVVARHIRRRRQPK